MVLLLRGVIRCVRVYAPLRQPSDFRDQLGSQKDIVGLAEKLEHAAQTFGIQVQ